MPSTIEHVTWAISHDFISSGFRVTGGPSLIPANVSIEWVFTLTEGTADKVRCGGGTAKMYGRPLDSPIDDLLLSTGSIGTGDSDNVITFVVVKDTIPDGWSKYTECRFTWQVEDGAGNVKTKWYKEGIKIKSFLDPEDIIYPYSEDVALSYYTYAVDTTLEEKPGLRVIYINGCTVRLPDISASVYEQAFIIEGIAASGNILHPNGATINDIAGAQTIPQHEGMILFQDGTTNWHALNPTLTIP